ncbi:MAG: hypothetical protein C5B49_01565 [Bdellovibrio sp.]|nr:MAG: hypothetical protein C5B49_01565 [Bdellovibrio sp.]
MLFFLTHSSQVAATVDFTAAVDCSDVNARKIGDRVQAELTRFNTGFDLLIELKNPRNQSGLSGSPNSAGPGVKAVRTFAQYFGFVPGFGRLFGSWVTEPEEVPDFYSQMKSIVRIAEEQLAMAISLANDEGVPISKRKSGVDRAAQLGESVIVFAKRDFKTGVNGAPSGSDPDHELLAGKISALEDSVEVAKFVSGRLGQVEFLLGPAHNGQGRNGQEMAAGPSSQLTTIEIARRIAGRISVLKKRGKAEEAEGLESVLTRIAKDQTRLPRVIPRELTSAETFLALAGSGRTHAQKKAYEAANHFTGDVNKVKLQFQVEGIDASEAGVGPGSDDSHPFHFEDKFFHGGSKIKGDSEGEGDSKIEVGSEVEVGSEGKFASQDFKITEVRFSAEYMFVTLTGEKDGTVLIVQALEDGSTVTWLLEQPGKRVAGIFKASYDHSN